MQCKFIYLYEYNQNISLKLFIYDLPYAVYKIIMYFKYFQK